MKYLEKIITKELLRKVLPKETENLSEDFSFYIDEDYIVFRDDGETLFDYNIYEFAFKCKEWILNQKNKDCFYIADQFSLNIESQMGVIKYFWCVLLKNNSRVSPEFKADSELEAIIKACEFILIKKESKWK